MDGDEAVAAFFGMPERQKGIEVLLATKWQEMELHYGQLCNKLEDESEKLAARLRKKLGEGSTRRGTEDVIAHGQFRAGHSQTEKTA